MDVKELLQELNLWDYYPSKLNRQNLFSLAQIDALKSKDIKPRTLFSKFVNGLVHYDSNCRFIDAEDLHTTNRGFRSRIQKSSPTETSSRLSHVHPLDLSSLLFMSCDPVARQDIVCRFWRCKHAFPFIVQLEQLTSPMLYAWPFRGLVATSVGIGVDETIELPLTELDFKVVSFLKLSDSDISKSNIINFVINRSTKGSSIFFHRNCTGSGKSRSEIIDGMVEAFPYIHSMAEGGPTLYLNLRGNALNHHTQRRYLMNISNVTIILLEANDLDILESFLVRGEGNSENKQVLLLTDVSNNTRDETLITRICEKEQSFDVNIVPIKDLRVPDIVHELKSRIYRSKSSALLGSYVAKAKDFEIDVDEDDIQNHLNGVKDVFEIITKRYEHRAENVLLPVQGNECLQFAMADIEYYKLRHIPRTETVNRYRERLQKDKHECRLVQYRLSSIESLTVFLTERLEDRHFDIFLRSLKLHLDHLTRGSVNNLFREYKTLFSAMRMGDRGSDTGIWSMKLKELDGKMNSSAILISDFLREMGQIFESRCWFENRDKMDAQVTDLKEVNTAVRILLEGYPIELMDGRSCSVPLQWVKAVLGGLRQEIGNARLKVISVLGVESSGKSTLLNIMFGCIFPVGSGRCTRGVYMYLLKTSPDHKSIDYVLILDTEGLFSSVMYFDEAGIRDKQERELATFVIGLSTLTIVNVMGENIEYLKDILPISAYAFLRMNLIGLNPRCKLLHHNVDKTRKNTLGWQAKFFENQLDKYTAEACDLERVQVRQFKDVIRFDPGVDVCYFPALFETITDEADYQDTISTFYSREAIKLKNNLLSDDSVTSIDELTRNLDRLWNAIKRENFVYEFRHILDAEAKAIFDSKFSEFQWKIRTDIHAKAIKFQERVCKSVSMDNIEAIREEMKSELQDYIQHKRNQFLSNLDSFIEESDTVLAKALQRLRNNCREDLSRITNECLDEVFQTLERDVCLREREIKYKQGDKQTVRSLEQYILNHITDADISSKNFEPEKHFENWAKQELTAEFVMTQEQVKEDALECLYAVFCSERAAVDDIRILQSSDLATFLPDRQHWPRETQGAWVKEQETACQLVKDVKKYCSVVVGNIRHRKRFYHRTFFREIALYVKNQRQRLEKKLNASHKFDVQLAAAACSYLLKQLTEFDFEKGLLSFNMVSSIKSCFIAKCLERRGGVTATKIIVDGCCHIIANNIVEQILSPQTGKTMSVLAVRIERFMMHHYTFFRSKLGLLCFVWKQLLLENDQTRLLEYIKYPLANIRSRISSVFGQDISGIEANTSTAALENEIIKPLVNEQLELICRTLQMESPSKLGHSLAIMKDFLNFLVEKLGPYLDLTDIRKYEHCCAEIEDADVFVQMLIEILRSDFYRNSLVSQIQLTVLQKNMIHDDIRLQVVSSIYFNVIGCEEVCHFCGMLCSSRQRHHDGPHSSAIHMPIGFKQLVLKECGTIPTVICFEEIEAENSVYNEVFRKEWTDMCFISEEGNNFWKYMFATHAPGMAISQGQLELQNIPESWCRLTRFEVLHWLDKQIKGFS